MPPEEYSSFEIFLNEKIKSRGLTSEKIAEITGIPLRHLESLESGRLEELPPVPYTRGYIVKLGTLLDFDPNVWWERIMGMGVIKSSGREDQMPVNRFKEPSRAIYVAAAGLGIVLLAYFGFRFATIFGQPALSVDYPKAEVTSVRDPQITLRGTARNADQVIINNEAVPVDKSGNWQKELSLSPGLNTLEITAKKFLGREARAVRQVVYEAPAAPPAAPPPTSSASSTSI